MTAKKSDRNKKKDVERLKLSQTGSQKSIQMMSLQERKQNIQGNGELIKNKVVTMFETVKDNMKGIISLYIKEIITQEERIEKVEAENKKLKSLLTKHKIKY